jgi:hypothetical protein
MRDGIKVSGLTLIQNASDSIRPPLRPSMRTRFSHHRVEVAEHQRQPQHVLEFDRFDEVNDGPADDPERVDAFKAQLAQLILADVLDVARGGVQPQPTVAVDVGHA